MICTIIVPPGLHTNERQFRIASCTPHGQFPGPARFEDVFRTRVGVDPKRRRTGWQSGHYVAHPFPIDEVIRLAHDAHVLVSRHYRIDQAYRNAYIEQVRQG